MEQDDLIRRIQKFLTIRVECGSGGGWVAPSPEDYREFYEIIIAIRNAKWDLDADGDATVEVRLTDRSRGRHPWVPFVPYHRYPEPITEEHWLAASSLLGVSGSLAREVDVLIAAQRQRMSEKKP